MGSSLNYAIELAVNLNTSQAEQKLDDLLSRVSRIQDAFRAVSDSTVASDAVDLSKQMNLIATQATVFEDAHAATSKQLTTHVSSLTKSNALHEKMRDMLGDSEDSIVEIEDHLEQFYKKKFPTINDQVEDFSDESSIISGIWAGFKDSFKWIITDLTNMTKSTFDLRKAFYATWQEEEQLHTINNRYYGSMLEVHKLTLRLTRDHHLLRTEAIEAYKTLADLRLPRESLEKLAGVTGKFSYNTGVSIQQTGEFINKLRVLGNSNSAVVFLDMMTEHMSAFGLSTRDMQMIMTSFSNTATDMSAILGEEGAAAASKNTIAMAGLAKAYGMSADAAAAMHNGLYSVSEAGMEFRALMLGTTDVIRDQDEVVRRLVSGQTILGSLMDQIDIDKNGKITGGIEQYQQLMITMRSVASSLGLASDQVENFTKLNILMRQSGATTADEMMEYAKTHAEAMGIPAATVDAAFKEYQSQQNVLRNYNEVMDRMSAAWMRIFAALGPHLAKIMEYIAENAIPIIENITETIGQWIEGIGALIDILKVVFLPITILIDLMNSATSSSDGLQKSWAALMAPFATLRDYFFGTAEESKKAGEAIGSFVKGTMGLLIAGAVIYATWTIMNRMIAATPVSRLAIIAVSLLAIGAAFLMLGAAVAMMAATGDAGLAVLGMLSVTILSIAAAIAVVAAFGPIGIAAVAALSLAFLSFGLTAMMVAAAIYIASSSLVELSKVVTTELAVNMLAVGAAAVFMASSFVLAAAVGIPAAIMFSVAVAGITLALLALVPSMWILESLGVSMHKAGLGMFYMSKYSENVANSVSRVGNGIVNMVESIVAYASLIGQFSSATDEYVAKIESAAESIHKAYMSKIKPAFDWADAAGLDKEARAQTISTIKVMKSDDFNASLQKRDEINVLREQVKSLKSIEKKLDKVGGGGDFDAILRLLVRYLPELEKNTVVDNPIFNTWQR